MEQEEQETGVIHPTVLPQRRGNGEHILLLEDEPELRERTARALTEHGYSVQACSTVAEAARVFHQAEGRIDLFVSDVVLPDGRGPELVFQFLAIRPELAALLVTGYVDENPDWERIHRERLPILQKPFTIDELLAQVRAAFR